MKIVFFAVLILFAIIGVSHIVFEIYCKLTKIENDGVCLVLAPKKESCADIEFSVRSRNKTHPPPTRARTSQRKHPPPILLNRNSRRIANGVRPIPILPRVCQSRNLLTPFPLLTQWQE